jgi:hypothetical protein
MKIARRDAANTTRAGSPQEPEKLPNGIVRVKLENTYARFGIVALRNPLFLATDADALPSFQQHIVFQGATPINFANPGATTVAAPNKVGAVDLARFAIVQQPGTNGHIVPAMLEGVSVCKIDILHDHHPYADIVHNDRTKLASDFIGSAEILYKEGGEETTGEKWCIVRLGSPTWPTYIGKADANIGTGSTGTVSVWYFDQNSLLWVDSGANITNCRNRSFPVFTNQWVSVSWVRGYFGYRWTPIVTPQECA